MSSVRHFYSSGLMLLKRVLSVREIFLGLLTSLDWRSVSNLYEALPEHFRRDLFGDSVWFSRQIGRNVKPLDVIPLRSAALGFADFMSLWHLSLHCLDLRDPRDHATLTPYFNYVTDCFMPSELFPAQPREAHYSAICFLPASAPQPFANTLWVAEVTADQVKIFRPMRHALRFVCAFSVSREIRQFAVSGEGSTVLLLDEHGHVSLVRLGPDSLRILRDTRLVIPEDEDLKSVFADENRFILRDRTWTFWEHCYDPERGKLSSRILCDPSTLFPTVLLKSGGKRFSSFPDFGRVGKSSYLYLPETENAPDCLVTAEFCPTPKEKEKRHPGTCHVLQLLSSPGDPNSEPHYLVVTNGAIVDYLTDYTRTSLFIVVLTWSDEFAFRRIPASVTRCRPEACSMTFDRTGTMNLGIYRIDLSDIVTKPGKLPPSFNATPLYYIPSDPSMLDEVPVWLNQQDDKKPYGKTFSWQTEAHYRAHANSRFLCVCQSHTCLLLFALAAEKKTPPFGIDISSTVEVNTVCSSAEMFCFAAITSQDARLKICSLCPEKAELFQTEMRNQTAPLESPVITTVRMMRSRP